MDVGQSAASGCIVRTVSIGIRLILVLAVIGFVYMGYIYIFGAAGAGPDWLTKGYTNQHYRKAEKFGKNSQYEEAIEEFKLAIETEPDSKGMVQDCRFNIAAAYEKIAEKWEPLSLGETPEAMEAYRKMNHALDGALEQYRLILKENPSNKAAQTRQTIIMIKKG